MLIAKYCIGSKNTPSSAERKNSEHATCSCMCFLQMFILFVCLCRVCMRGSRSKGKHSWHLLPCSGVCIFLTFLCKESAIIKRKSRDLSGSASLALWANMNQSTTQLGSKRRSQGKHLYATFTIFLCRPVNVRPVSMYFCLFFNSILFYLLSLGGIIASFPSFWLFISTKMALLPAPILLWVLLHLHVLSSAAPPAHLSVKSVVKYVLRVYTC